jgi:transcription initiation factor IIE alpha subunit
MDRAWMYDLARIDPMYLENVHQFIEEAKRHANKQNKNDIFCCHTPFRDSGNEASIRVPRMFHSHI